MHEIAGEAGRKREDVWHAVEDTRFPYARIATTPLVFVVISSRDDIEQVRLIFVRGRDREGVDVDVGMGRCSVVLKTIRP